MNEPSPRQLLSFGIGFSLYQPAIKIALKMVFKESRFKPSFAVLLLFSISSCFPEIHGGKILFLLPLSSKSMANVFEPLAIALSERGHQLTVIAPVQFKFSPAINKTVTQMVPATAEELFRDYPEPFEIRRQNKLFAFPVPFQDKYCNILYDNVEFRGILSEKFDAVVINPFYHDCFAGLLHKMGSPIIFVASLPLPPVMSEALGTHLPTSFVPIPSLADLSARFSFKQRLTNFLFKTHFKYTFEWQLRPYLETIYRKKLGQDVPSIEDIYKRQGSIVLSNAHFSLTHARPNLPNIIEIGGIHCTPSKPLPKDLAEFADNAKDGFIVFSLGSIIKSKNLPESVRLAFVNAFSKLKEKVIWKWDKDGGMSDLPKNVKLVKWLPQQDLLGHPNIKLFITHGGLLSTEEAAYHGVPLLGFPVFVDQDHNMKQAEVLGFGVKGEILDLTEPRLTPLIRRLLDNPQYMIKAKQLSTIFRDQPQSPLERAVYWTEYVLRHKGAYHLQSGALQLNIIQYHSVDVMAFLALVAVTFLLFVYYVGKLLFGIVCSRKRSISKSVSKGNKKKKA